MPRINTREEMVKFVITEATRVDGSIDLRALENLLLGALAGEACRVWIEAGDLAETNDYPILAGTFWDKATAVEASVA